MNHPDSSQNQAEFVKKSQELPLKPFSQVSAATKNESTSTLDQIEYEVEPTAKKENSSEESRHSSSKSKKQRKAKPHVETELEKKKVCKEKIRQMQLKNREDQQKYNIRDADIE